MTPVDLVGMMPHDVAVPDRVDWPEAPPQTRAGEALTAVIMATFRLNGQFMDVAQQLARAGAITATEWRVLGGVLDEPHSAAEIGRLMGMSRQGVQRVADQLVDRGLARYRTNPAHRRAKLMVCTDAGYWAVRQISLVQPPWANQIGAAIGHRELQEILTTMQRLVDALEADEAAHDGTLRYEEGSS